MHLQFYGSLGRKPGWRLSVRSSLLGSVKLGLESIIFGKTLFFLGTSMSTERRASTPPVKPVDGLPQPHFNNPTISQYTTVQYSQPVTQDQACSQSSAISRFVLFFWVPSADSRCLQMTPDASTWLQIIPDDYRWFQMTPDVSRWLQRTPDASRWAKPCCF